MGDGLISGAYGISAGIINNAMAEHREGRARYENYKYNEMAANSAYKRTRALQNEFYTPKAMLNQLRGAGMSPSVLSESGVGNSGQAAPQGAGASGITPNTYGVDPMTAANIMLASSEARKNNAEADRISGVGKRGAAEVAEIVARTLGEKAKTAYTKLQSDLADIELYKADETKEYNIKEAREKAEAAEHNAHYIMYLARTQNAISQVNQATIVEKVRSEYLKNENLRTQKELMQAQIGLSDAEAAKVSGEIEKWREELLQKWTSLQLEQDRNNTYRKSVLVDEKFKKESIEQLYAKLAQDKEIADKINELRHKELVETWVDDMLGHVVNAAVSVLNIATKME